MWVGERYLTGQTPFVLHSYVFISLRPPPRPNESVTTKLPLKLIRGIRCYFCLRLRVSHIRDLHNYPLGVLPRYFCQASIMYKYLRWHMMYTILLFLLVILAGRSKHVIVARNSLGRPGYLLFDNTPLECDVNNIKVQEAAAYVNLVSSFL